MSRTHAHVPEHVRVFRDGETYAEVHNHHSPYWWAKRGQCTIDEPTDGMGRLADGRRATCFRELSVVSKVITGSWAREARRLRSNAEYGRRGRAVIENRRAVRDTLHRAALEYNSGLDGEPEVMPDPDEHCLCRHCISW